MKKTLVLISILMSASSYASEIKCSSQHSDATIYLKSTSKDKFDLSRLNGARIETLIKGQVWPEEIIFPVGVNQGIANGHMFGLHGDIRVTANINQEVNNIRGTIYILGESDGKYIFECPLETP